jgi:hypothetical protein
MFQALKKNAAEAMIISASGEIKLKENETMKNLKTLAALILALCMIFSVTVVNAEGTAQRFEAEYATITGSVPGLVSVFYGASNKCMLAASPNSSNGFVVSNCYVEGNDDDQPVITFTIVSDVEAEAQVLLCVGPSWQFDASFNTLYQDTDVNTAYAMTFNGEALTTTATVAGGEIALDEIDEDTKVPAATAYVVADFGTVTLKAGENTFTIAATAGSQFIDYLELVTSANVTMEKDLTHTYRAYDEDEMEYVELTIE